MTKTRLLSGPLECRDNPSAWAGLLDAALPALDYAAPDALARLAAPGSVPAWTLGGGTALALRLGHRISDDIDIFLSGVGLRLLAPANNPMSRLIDEHPQWPGHYLKFSRPEGEIDFLSSALQTSPGYTQEIFRSRPIALETVAEVIVKKIRYRGANFTPRDAFDLACACQEKPEILVTIAYETEDALPRLAQGLNILAGRAPEAVKAQVRATPRFASIRDDAVNLANECLRKVLSVLENPATPENTRHMSRIIDDIDAITSGTSPGKIKFGWRGIGEAEKQDRLRLLDQYPISTKAALVDLWKKRDPAAFHAWDDRGRLPEIIPAGKTQKRRDTRGGIAD